MSPPDHTIFLHIPKTAGSTLYRILERHYRFSQIYTIWQTGTLDEFLTLPDDQKRKIRLLRGHAGYGLHNNLPGRATYFTILRNPTRRTISYYHFIRRTPHHYCHQQIVENGWTLGQFLANKADPMADNAQTRLLAGMASGQEVPFGHCTEAHLKQAKAHLQQMAVVGLTERFDETLLLLQATFGWQKLYYVNQNVTKKPTPPSALPAETTTLLEQVNHLDWELYHFAERLFEAQIKKQQGDWEERLARFRRQNRWLRPLTQLLFDARKFSIRTTFREWLSD